MKLKKKTIKKRSKKITIKKNDEQNWKTKWNQMLRDEIEKKN
jgi:hypothetical protein